MTGFTCGHPMHKITFEQGRIIYLYNTAIVHMAAFAQIDIAPVHILLIVTGPAIIVCYIAFTITGIYFCMAAKQRNIDILRMTFDAIGAIY